MEPSKEAINVRLCQLNGQLWGRGVTFAGGNSTTKRSLNKETLLDALNVLYDECNNDSLKKNDECISKFVDKYRPIVSQLKQMRVNISDFEVKDLIGRGHFGEVHVVREKCTGDIYAMKTLKKDITLKHQSMAFFEEERDIMALSKSDWLVRLQHAFQDTAKLFLIMEYCPGGDLAGLLERRGKPLEEKESVFYLAEMILALKDLHSLGFIHRDVKPDNVLLDRCGHLKLADFGSAARLSNLGNVKSSMPVGTTEYISPEILMSLENPKKISHGTPCDYWSLGIIAYELVTSKTPFSNTAKNTVCTYNRIIEHGSNTQAVSMTYPNIITNERTITDGYKKFVNALLHPVPIKRPDCTSVLKFKVFDNIHWSSLRHQVPPFVPIVNGQDDISNFLELEKQQPKLSVENFRSKLNFSGKNLPFIGFTYSQDINLSSYGDGSEKEDSKKADSTGSSGHSSGSTNVFNTSLNGTVICLSNTRETEKLLESRKREIDSLHKQLALVLSKQKIHDDKEEKLIHIENQRSDLEKNLAEMLCINQKLQNQLELEHKERKILETKSLQLIQGAKKKWKEKTESQVSSLKSIISQHEIKQTEYDHTIRGLEYELKSKVDSLEKCSRNLEAFQTFKNSQSGCMEKVWKMSRDSVIEMERFSQESNEQIKNITRKMNTELELRVKIESELKNTVESLKLVEEREMNLLDTVRKESDVHTKEILSWSYKLDGKCQEIRDLNNELSELKCKNCKLLRANEELTGNEKRILKNVENLEMNFRDTLHFERQIKNLSATIATLKVDEEAKNAQYLEIVKEKAEMKTTLDRAIACEEKHRDRVSILEDLVNKLQRDVAILENLKLEHNTSTVADKTDLHMSVENIANSERICVLQEQISKLEEQLKTSREECTLTKQETRKVNSALWKKEKELSDCDLDRRFAERELKDANSQISNLQSELKKSISDHQLVLKDLQNAIVTKDNEISATKETVSSLNCSIADCEKQLKNAQSLNENNSTKYLLLKQKTTSDVQSLNEKIEKLESDVHASEERRIKAESAAEGFCKENKATENEKYSEREQRIRLEVMLQERNKESDSLQKNYKMLQKTCTVLEEQLIDFEKLMAVQEAENVESKTEINKLRNLLESGHVESSKLQKVLDVQKFNIISIEGKYQECSKKLEFELSKNAEIEKQINNVLRQEVSMSSEMSNQSLEISKFKSEIKLLKAEIQAKEAEIMCLKEECTHLLTDVATLREDNMSMQLELKEYKENNENLQALIEEREEEFTARQYHWQQCELKADATIAQQIKLIDYLQTRMEEVSKRKKTLGDMLFGKSTKETIILPSTPQTPLSNRLMTDQQIRNSFRETPKHREAKERISALQQKLNTPTAKNHNEIEKLSNLKSTAIEGWVKIQRESVLVKVHLKLLSDCLKWQEDKKNVYGDFALKGNLQINKNLVSNDTDIVLSDCERKSAFKIFTTERSLLIVCSSATQKEDWMSALQKNSNISTKEVDHQTISKAYKPTLLVKSDKNNMKINFILEIKKDIFLIGAEKDLHCYFRNVGKEEPVLVSDMKGMQKVRVIPNIDQIVFLDSDGQLMHTSLRQFVAFLKTTQNCAQTDAPEFQYLSSDNDVTLFEISPQTSSADRVLLCSTMSSSLAIYEYENLKMSFTLLRHLKTEPVSCMRFTQHTVLVGSHKFYEIDLKSFKVEEFLDPSDTSLYHAVYASKNSIYPLAIVQTKSRAEDKVIEYLLCYDGFGIFVDEYGLRSRRNDVKWAHRPSQIVFRRPFIFVVYYSSVEVIHLSGDAFQRSWSDSDSVNSCSSSNSSNCVKKMSVELNAPSYLGKSLTPSSIYVSNKNNTTHAAEICELNGSEIFKSDNLGASIDTLDTVDDLDSCKNVQNNMDVSLSMLTDVDMNLSQDSSIEASTDFSLKIKAKAKVINSLKRENNKVSAIQELLSRQNADFKQSKAEESDSSFDGSDPDSSNEDSTSSRKYTNQSNNVKFNKNCLKTNGSHDTNE
ncbi:citron rho-interacting kinase sticky [Arctopsyche grandis]|uniref:citron rho-interacting kinase sticky n=1 Tax=Arctopsyche grandis TaxID=121162 RepID=UPI00406D7F7F